MIGLEIGVNKKNVFIEIYGEDNNNYVEFIYKKEITNNSITTKVILQTEEYNSFSITQNIHNKKLDISMNNFIFTEQIQNIFLPKEYNILINNIYIQRFIKNEGK